MKAIFILLFCVTMQSSWLFSQVQLDFEIPECDITSVNELYHSNNISVFPNPFSAEINIQLNEVILKFGKAVIEIFDVTGSVIYTHTNFDTNSVSIDMSAMSQGLYLIKISNGTEFYSKKIIKN